MVLRKILSHKWPLLFSLLLLTSLFLWLANAHRQLQSTQHILGWILMGLACIMTSYNLRKRLSILPLGNNKTWYLFHLYMGLLSSVVFSLHAGWTWPSSPINQALWLGSIAILLSGVLGFAVNKLLTPLVSSQGERLIFDRIPGHISLNRERSQLLMLDAAASKAGKPLADYYHHKLLDVFNHSGQLGLTLFVQQKRLERHLIELNEIGRYLDSENQQRLKQLNGLLKQKSMLDWQYSTLSIIRAWTLLHVPAIGFTFLVLIAHVIIQYAFEMRQPW